MSKNQLFSTFSPHKEAKSRADKNYSPQPWWVSVFVAGTKLSPICSPKMYVERTPKWWSPASSGITSLLEINAASTQSDGFLQFFARRQFLRAQEFPSCRRNRVVNYNSRNDSKCAM